jgi:Tfp pilus assembly PilM family ATPase
MLSRLTPIGLDIGGRCVHAAQARWTRSGPEVTAFGAMNRPGLPSAVGEGGGVLGSGEAERIAGALDRLGFAGRDVVVSVPEGRMVSASLELPPRASGAPLEAIARQELARAARCEAGEIETAWWELPGAGRAGEATHAMGVGVRHADAAGLIGALEGAGLRVVRLDTPMTTLARAAGRAIGATTELTAVLDLGWSSAQLLVLRGKLLVYQRAVAELGLARCCAQIASGAGVDVGEAELAVRDVGCCGEDGGWGFGAEVRSRCAALVDEAGEQVRLSLAYAQRRFDAGVSGVLTLGGGSDLKGVVERLAERSGAPARALRAAELARVGPGAVGEIGVQALELALSGGAGAGVNTAGVAA